MNNTTLGARIQEGRKSAGLSQEALGEQLGVSRQAVSKWEADAAIPELDKLIAMSRLFGQPVGVLLGVEFPPEESAPEDAPSRELTEKELAAIETIAARYAPAGRSPRRKWPLILAAVGGGTAAALLVFLLVWTASLNRQVDSLRQNILNVQSSVSGQIGGISSQISQQINDILGEKTNILTSYTLRAVEADLDMETVVFSLSAQLRQWTEDTALTFTAEAGRETITVPGVHQGGGVFTGELTAPMAGSIAFSATAATGEGNETATMEVRSDCAPENFQPQIDAFLGSTCSYGHVGAEWLSLQIAPPQNADAVSRLDLTAMDLCLFRDGSAVPAETQPLPELLTLYRQSDYGELDASNWDCGFSFDLGSGQTAAAALRLRERGGQTRWVLLDAWAGASYSVPQSLFIDDTVPWQPGEPIPTR